MAPLTKPETILRQAEGLVSVGQSHAALQSLTEMFASKRFRSTPLITLEPIMHRFIELCVDMRKGRTAKEGLMQYKNIAQNTSVASIESVIKQFLSLADAKVKEAQRQAQAAVSSMTASLQDVDDLEASETPESILLGVVSGDQSKDRTDRALVTPWLKFLWESYRTSLETLKNNARLEAIYQQIAQQAFTFCLTHSRKVEFRRLCETLRLHLSNVAKYSHQQHSINLSDPDTLQHHLDTRFAQLNTSVDLELWQEAFRSVEDVHNLLTMAKKAPRPSMMANYYEKLTKIFLMSGNALYHATAWSRYYAIVSNNNIAGITSPMNAEEMSRLAGQVLISALAVPVGLQVEEQEDSLKGKNARLTALLGLTKMPTRAGLLKDALSRDVLRLSPAPIQKLYQILEVTFDPLSLCSTISPLLTSLSHDSSYAQYLLLLQRALLSRLLNQLSQVYSNVKFDTLFDLVEPLRESVESETAEGETKKTMVFTNEEVEAYVMGCARRGELNIKVDHKEGSITFIDDAYAISSPSTTTSITAPVASSSKVQLQSLVGGGRETTIQPSLSETIHTRLSRIASSLHNTVLILDPPQPPLPQEEELKDLIASVTAERKALQIKRALVARRRELLSELSARKEKEESSRRAEVNRREKEEEQRRMREEVRVREVERAKRQVEAIRVDEAKKYAKTLVEKGILRAGDVDKLESIDTENLISIQVAQLEKEKSLTNDRLRLISKRIDHIERAYRKEERPLLSLDYTHQLSLDRATHAQNQLALIESSKRQHKEDLETKKRLGRMVKEYGGWKSVLEERKGEEFRRRQEVARKRIESEKEKRRVSVLKAWEEERERREREEEERRKGEEEERRKEEEHRAEEERKRIEEQERLAAEELARKKREEEVAAQRAQREKERQEAMEKARLQQQREEEAEERRRQRRLAELEAATSGKPISAGGGGDRSPFGSVRGGPSAVRSANGQESVWRRSASGAGTTRPSATATTDVPARSESPGPGAAAAAGKYRPGAYAASGGGGWRERAAAKEAAGVGGGGSGGASPNRTASPAPARAEEKERKSNVDEDGFTTVGKGGSTRLAAWSPGIILTNQSSAKSRLRKDSKPNLNTKYRIVCFERVFQSYGGQAS
ncbi:Eukaryotic translation initiation factor 3 subunit A [Leucoagaricus sp. SymC.cos]|nr:Eukaryotic translation initiation factor 3 subunit A [Leucoagaricus sp. SymC.cos]